MPQQVRWGLTRGWNPVRRQGGAQTNLDKAALDLAIQNFGRQIQGADVTLLHYHGVSGHVSPSGAASAVGNASGITVISSGHLCGRSGSGWVSAVGRLCRTLEGD